MVTEVLSVKGMSCNHCVKAVETSVGALEGVTHVDVELSEGKVKVEFDNSKASIQEIKKTIEEQGYDVE